MEHDDQPAFSRCQVVHNLSIGHLSYLSFDGDCTFETLLTIPYEVKPKCGQLGYCIACIQTTPRPTSCSSILLKASSRPSLSWTLRKKTFPHHGDRNNATPLEKNALSITLCGGFSCIRFALGSMALSIYYHSTALKKADPYRLTRSYTFHISIAFLLKI